MQLQHRSPGLITSPTLCEMRWGIGRLELLVTDEQRARFRRQREKLNIAIIARDADAVARHAAAMGRAYSILDAEAIAAGHTPLNPNVWEVQLSDGRVVALVKTNAEASLAARQEGYAAVWTLREIAKLIEANGSIMPEWLPTLPATAPKAVLDDISDDEIPF
jgi:hypothetical protein